MELSFYVLTVVVGGLAALTGLLARHALMQATRSLEQLRMDIKELAARIDALNELLLDHESRISKLEVVVHGVQRP